MQSSGRLSEVRRLGCNLPISRGRNRRRSQNCPSLRTVAILAHNLFVRRLRYAIQAQNGAQNEKATRCRVSASGLRRVIAPFMVTVAELDLLESATLVAVTITGFRTGIAAGAV